MNAVLSEKQLDYVTYAIIQTEQIVPDPVTGKKRLILIESEKERGSA